jgi:hypothetical protein
MILNTVYPQSSTGFVSKKGGICFRIDDNKPISKYLEYAALFNNYNQKFSFAINLGNNITITPDYIDGLRQIQANGHEMMDHTPWHRTNYFTTILPTDYYRGHPGVQRISGNKVELKYADVNIGDAKRTGYVNINGDIVTSTSGIFSSFSQSDCYLYFPSLDQLVFIDESFGWIDQDTIKITDFWRNDIDLGSHQNVQFYNFDFYGVHLTVDALKALAEESTRLVNYYGLERPYTWIQPGGYFPHVNRNEVKQACGELGFKSADVKTYGHYSIKTFNEYNPDDDKQFGMFWEDFRDDAWTLEQCKELIADRIAKHYVAFGHSHFNELLGGWEVYLDRTEKLIRWCIANNIPIRTYSEWADILYNQIPDPDENIFPLLNIDLDVNDVPDGFNPSEKAVLEKDDGVPTVNDYCYSINTAGEIFSIRNLGGIEKGENEFEIWTKGVPGDFIEVTFRVGSQNLVYKFPAENAVWTKYNLAQSVNGNTSLSIPNDISLIDVTINCSNYSAGEVKISGMKLAKSLGFSDYLSVSPTNQLVSYNSGSTTFTVTSNTEWSVSDDAGWLNVSPGSSSGNGTITATYTDNPVTSQRSGTITVTGGGIIRTVTVTQSAQPFALEVTPVERNVSHTSGSTTFSVTSNTNWNVSDDAEWLSVSPASGSGSGTVTVSYTVNPNTAQRSGTVNVAGGGITDTVIVIQEAQPFMLTASPSNISVGYGLGNATFTITSNTSWTVNDDVGWISTFPSSGSGNESVILIYEYNPNTSQRIGTITVSGGGITDTVLVRQDAKKFLTIFPLDTTLSSRSGVFNLIINSNTIWEIKEELDWINLNKYTGSNTDTINVNYDLNEDITDRDGLISIYGEKDTCEFIVRQIAHSYLFISLDTQTVSADTGSITVGVESNIRWCVLDSVDWIMVAPDTGEGVASVTVRYIANIDSLSRKGVLFFIGDTLTDKFILIQGGLEVYSIVALPDPDEGGTVTGSGKYLYGTNVKVIAFPSEGWMFKSWKEDSLEISNDSVYSFIAVAQRTLSAEFEKILTVTKNEKELPENFELYQNYPNPFNPTTTIKYSIPELSFVTLKIYDILGNEVATLINEEQSVGYYFVSVYASSMSSGIYFYQLKAGSYTQTKRMIILK